MSHVTTLSTTVRLKDLDLLLESLQGSGTIERSGNNIFLNNPGLPILQFRKEGNEYKVMAETWGYEKQVEALKSKIENKYKMGALQRVLKKMHYNSTQQISENVVVARRY